MGIFFVFTAIVGYATGGVIIARKLGNIPTAMLVPMYCGGVAIVQFFAVKVLQGFGQPIDTSFPTSIPWWLFALVIPVAIADSSYVFAIKTLPLPLVATCIAGYPALTALIDKLFFGGTLPSVRTMCAMVVIMFGVWLAVADPANATLGH